MHTGGGQTGEVYFCIDCHQWRWTTKSYPAGAIVSLPPWLSQHQVLQSTENREQGMQGAGMGLCKIKTLAVYNPGSHLEVVSLWPFLWPSSQGFTAWLQMTFTRFPQGGRGSWEHGKGPMFPFTISGCDYLPFINVKIGPPRIVICL